MSVIIKTRKFFHLSNREKLGFFEACLVMVFSIIAIKIVPFRFLSRCLGTHMASSPAVNKATNEQSIYLVQKSIDRVSNNFPYKVICMPEAMTAKLMLARRGIDSTLYMGVKKNESGDLAAHAWLRAGEIFLTGELEKDDFTVVASFA
jgi:hypothetical protein